MAVTDMFFSAGKSDLLSDTIELSSDTIEAMLVKSSYTNVAGDTVVTTPAAQEISTTGYVGGFGGSGRKALAGKSFVVSGTQAEFHANTITWTGLATGDTLAGMVIYKKLTSDALSHLLTAYNLPSTPTNGGDVSVVPASSGFLILT